MLIKCYFLLQISTQNRPNKWVNRGARNEQLTLTDSKSLNYRSIYISIIIILFKVLVIGGFSGASTASFLSFDVSWCDLLVQLWAFLYIHIMLENNCILLVVFFLNSDVRAIAFDVWYFLWLRVLIVLIFWWLDIRESQVYLGMFDFVVLVKGSFRTIWFFTVFHHTFIESLYFMGCPSKPFILLMVLFWTAKTFFILIIITLLLRIWRV